MGTHLDAIAGWRRRAGRAAAVVLLGGLALAPPAQAGPDGSAGQPPPLPPGIRSIEPHKSITARFAPDAGSSRLGTIAAYTRLGVRGSASGPGCDHRWLAIEPFGWVCEDLVEMSRQAPGGIEMPRLERGELVPGVYAKVTGAGAKSYHYQAPLLSEARELAGSVTVRRYAELTIDMPATAAPPAGDAGPVPAAWPGGPRAFWQVSKDEYVPLDQLSLHDPSRFHGVRLGDETGLTLPVGFVYDVTNPQRGVTTTRTAQGGGGGRRLPGRSAWAVREIARDGAGRATAYRVGEREWVPARLMRLAELTPPPDRTRPGERWVDVDTDRQVLVAYEGEQPVYATLVSTGKRKFPTAPGVYRIWIKFAETDMSGQMGDEAPYSVATVPWTQYFSKDLALHTAYWHDGFGSARSHGCVNLSPIDSRFLYFWSDPPVPPGWSMAHGHVDRPGSMVRIRSSADPTPAFQGYARDVWEQRGVTGG